MNFPTTRVQPEQIEKTPAYMISRSIVGYEDVITDRQTYCTDADGRLVHTAVVDEHGQPFLQVVEAIPRQIDHVETASIEDEPEPVTGLWIACACAFAAGVISVWYFF